MDHSITVERFGLRLRPVQLSDAGFIVNLRNSPDAIGFVGDGADSEASQRHWLDKYFARPGDYYFIIELARDCQTLGTIGVYDIHDGSGEVGRWVMSKGSLFATASIWLIYHVSFDILGLDVVRGTVVESNKNVISFHKKIGVHFTSRSEPRIIGGKSVNILACRVDRAEWPPIAATLAGYALTAEKLFTRDNPDSRNNCSVKNQ